MALSYFLGSNWGRCFTAGPLMALFQGRHLEVRFSNLLPINELIACEDLAP